MLKIKKILCIGNNTIDTDDYCQKLSAEYNIKYQGLLNNINLTINGCYHTSIADLTDSELLSISNCFDKVIFLDNYQQDSVLKDTSEMMKNIITNNDISFKSFSSDNVIFFGCSHTAGVGFSDKTKTFPWLISKLQNKTPSIGGYSGCGNYLIDDKLNEYSLQHKCVIVQFTDIFRIRYLDSSKNTVIHVPGGEYTKEEFAMFDEPRLAWEFERIVDRTVARLRDADANFLFFQLTHQNNLDQKTKLYMSKYKEFCYMPSDTFVDFAEDLMHYGPLTPHNIATNLIDKWNLLYAKN